MKTAELKVANTQFDFVSTELVTHVRDIDFRDQHVVLYLENDTLVAFRSDLVLSIQTRQD
jgi:hypothetical protein